MKLITKVTGSLAALMLVIFLVVGNVQAYGIIDLVATVNPNVNNSFTAGDVTGTAEYFIGIDPTSAYGANRIQLVFEADIFASVTNLTLTSSTPAGWNTTLGPNGIDFSVNSFGVPGVLNPEETISFTVDYILTDTQAFSHGTDPNNTLWAWDQDGPDPWSQSVSAGLYDGGFWPVAEGGSSTESIPVPSTMVLLGLGLTGLVGMGIGKKRKQNEQK